MNKVIPILSLTVAAFDIFISTIAMITSAIALDVSQVWLVAAPAAVVALVVSLVSVGFDAFFWKSKLCRAALFVNVAAFALSGASTVMWLCAR